MNFKTLNLPENISATFVNLALNGISAFLLLFLGLWFARWARKRLRKSRLGGRHLDATLRPVLAGLVFYLILSMTLFIFLTQLGIPSTSLLAIFGAAGLAIGLALKDTLSNIASGVMLLILRPLQVGEFIDTPVFSGTIEEIGLFATHIKNLEGLHVYIPNSQVWSQRLTNFSRHIRRKFVCEIGVSYNADLPTTLALLCNTMDGHVFVEAAPEAFVMNFGDSAVTLSCRCWLPAEDWLQNTSDLRIALKTALDKAKIDIPYPQIVVHKP